MALSASYEGMASIADRVLNLSEEYAIEVEDIYKTIESLESDWKGSDNLAYVNKAKEYKETMDALRDIIVEYANFLGESANILNETQQEIRNQVGD